jgi:hypothetical protein
MTNAIRAVYHPKNGGSTHMKQYSGQDWYKIMLKFGRILNQDLPKEVNLHLYEWDENEEEWDSFILFHEYVLIGEKSGDNSYNHPKRQDPVIEDVVRAIDEFRDQGLTGITYIIHHGDGHFADTTTIRT